MIPQINLEIIWNTQINIFGIGCLAKKLVLTFNIKGERQWRHNRVQLVQAVLGVTLRLTPLHQASVWQSLAHSEPAHSNALTDNHVSAGKNTKRLGLQQAEDGQMEVVWRQIHCLKSNALSHNVREDVATSLHYPRTSGTLSSST